MGKLGCSRKNPHFLQKFCHLQVGKKLILIIVSAPGHRVGGLLPISCGENMDVLWIDPLEFLNLNVIHNQNNQIGVLQ